MPSGCRPKTHGDFPPENLPASPDGNSGKGQNPRLNPKSLPDGKFFEHYS